MNIALWFKDLYSALESKWGLAGALLAVCLLIIVLLIRQIISGKDKQIKALSDENKDYRDKFIAILEKRLDTTPANQSQQS
ncbi:hypothetical protein DYBT9275_02726 [Dyadobacter sp. CECT 9275]|uniref:Uncharacterized protein n=1 Tax=Dyadobacter helix TaxID=2822344 RepID=A0A916JCA7_9BACT|nr:hypothetical protein [Dyadobacter sp. CECT 9275]CAG5001710.1 hypothetical protein DYBT9275_02726 [Dyadobacter sp. CECT 9275]